MRPYGSMGGWQPYPSRDARVAANRCPTSRARGSRSAIVAATRTIAADDSDFGRTAERRLAPPPKGSGGPRDAQRHRPPICLGRASTAMRIERRDLFAQAADTPQPGTRNHKTRIVQEHRPFATLTADWFIRGRTRRLGRIWLGGAPKAARRHRGAHGPDPSAADVAAMQALHIACNQHRITLPDSGSIGNPRGRGYQ